MDSEEEGEEEDEEEGREDDSDDELLEGLDNDPEASNIGVQGFVPSGQRTTRTPYVVSQWWWLDVSTIA